MDALELLLTRSSNNKLCAPAPAGDVLENILNAGLRAPDHANLSPFKFIVCQDEGLNKLSSIFKDAAVAEGKTEAEIEKATKAPFRAPMIILGICQYKEHEKVPRVEQIGTTACAVQNMQMAAFAQGFNGIWRTGGFAHSESVRAALGLEQQDEIVGFLYLGTTENETVIKRQKPMESVVSYWQ